MLWKLQFQARELCEFSVSTSAGRPVLLKNATADASVSWPAILAAHASTAGELDVIGEEMREIAQDETVLLMLARVTQVWARKV
jgi:hypothetical protein